MGTIQFTRKIGRYATTPFINSLLSRIQFTRKIGRYATGKTVRKQP